MLVTALVILGAFGSAQQQLQDGDTVIVVAGPLNVRDGPGTGATAIDQLQESQSAQIADGSPYWADGYWWWNVLTDSDTLGWIAEGSGGEDYIALLHRSAGPIMQDSTSEPQTHAPTDADTAESESDTADSGVVTADLVLPNTAEDAALPAQAGPPDPAAAMALPEVEAEEAEEELEGEPFPYAHLPESVREQRLQIDADFGGLQIVMAQFHSGPGRGGFAYGWAVPESSNTNILRFYWCESGLLTAGPPFFEAVEFTGTADIDFTDGKLSIGDLTVSCAGKAGLRMRADTMDRLLAFLWPAWGHAVRRSGDDELPDLFVADGETLIMGSVSWLEVHSGTRADEDWRCAMRESGINPLLTDSLEAIALRCQRDLTDSDGIEMLSIDTDDVELVWEVQ